MDVIHVTVDSACPAGESDTLGCRLQHLARLHRALLRRTLEDAGLHPGQEQVLTVLWQNGSRTQADLAAALEIDTSTVSKTLTRMERAGFVSRCRAEGDKRAVLVSTTPQGDALQSADQRAHRRRRCPPHQRPHPRRAGDLVPAAAPRRG